jgi:hypothetical protein
LNLRGPEALLIKIWQLQTYEIKDLSGIEDSLL